MAKYTTTIDVWKLTASERNKLQRGQWVSAGLNGPKGVWIGQKTNGVDVVMWHGNATRRASYPDYIKMLINYVKS